jgi:hypothetical protein
VSSHFKPAASPLDCPDNRPKTSQIFSDSSTATYSADEYVPVSGRSPSNKRINCLTLLVAPWPPSSETPETVSSSFET